MKPWTQLLAITGLLFVVLASPASAQKDAPLEIFSVKVTEYHCPVSIAPDLSNQAIVDLLMKPKSEFGKVTETVRFTTVSNTPASVQVGRQENVVTATTSSRGGQTRQMTTYQVGTIIQVMLARRDNKVVMEVEYNSSRFVDGDDDEENLRPDIDEIELQTTLLADLDQPILVGGSTKNGSSKFVVITLLK